MNIGCAYNIVINVKVSAMLACQEWRYVTVARRNYLLVMKLISKKIDK